MELTEELTYATVRISRQSEECIGTGFIVLLHEDGKTPMPFVVTNDHIIGNNDKADVVFELCKRDGNGNPIDTDVCEIRSTAGEWIRHPDADIDLRFLPLDPKLGGKNVFIRTVPTNLIWSEDRIRKELCAMENVVMVGYPYGLADNYNHKPVFRRGITATHPKLDYNGKREILLDITTFTGSSGSPVFILDTHGYATANGSCSLGNPRIILLGIFYGHHSAECFLNLKLPLSLGIAIKASRILEFEQYLQRRYAGGK